MEKPVKNLAKIAKRNNGKKPASTQVSKTVVQKREVSKPISQEEEMKLRVKETVDNLLQDVDLRNPNEIAASKAEIQTETISTVQRENTSWLEEQIEKLTTDNEALTNELAVVRQEYDNLYNNMQQYASTGAIPQDMVDQGSVKQTLINEFKLIQGNMVNMGVAQQPIQRIIQPGESTMIINPVQFLNRLIMLFPFLATEKRF